MGTWTRTPLEQGRKRRSALGNLVASDESQVPSDSQHHEWLETFKVIEYARGGFLQDPQHLRHGGL